MKKTIFKTVAATAVVAVTMALSSVAAFAKTTTYKLDEDETIAAAGAFKDSATDFTLETGVLEVNFNEKHTEVDKSFNNVEYSYSYKLNTINDSDIQKSGKNIIKFTGKQGDKISIVIKGNEVPFSTRIQENGNTTTLINTVDNKAKLEEISYTLTADGTAYIYAPKTNIPETQSKAQSLYVFSITTETKDEEVADGLSKTANGGVYVLGADSYIIAAVSTADLDKEQLTVKIGDQEKTTNTVYNSVMIGDTEVKASDVNGEYLYAVKVEGANGNPKVNKFTVE